MAAKPKLSLEEWNHAREVWEADTRKGFPWLIDELKLPVSSEAVRLRSNSEGWSRDEKPSLDKKTKLVPSIKTNPGVEQASKVKTIASVDKNKTEEVDRLHGNSRYKYEYDEQARKLCLLGATDVEIADFFGVTETTVNNWKNDYPSFLESLRSGKIMADANISDRLYQRALGYSHEEEKVFNNMGEILRAETTKHYPPDTGAIKLWLLNRRPKDWKANVEAPVEINLNVFPAKEVLDSIYEKALESAAKRDQILVGRRERLGITIEQS
ncbi:MAG: hypothetical protein RIR39_1675 [Pseudomonadota bacterium]|jgi:hypothetical protein